MVTVVSMRGPGRPMNLTPEVAERIVGWVEKGLTNARAARASLVGESTFYQWLAKAEEPGSDPMYAEFADAISHARERRVAKLLSLVEEAADDDWRAAAWILEHGDSRVDFQKVTKTELSGPGGTPLGSAGTEPEQPVDAEAVAAMAAIMDRAFPPKAIDVAGTEVVNVDQVVDAVDAEIIEPPSSNGNNTTNGKLHG